MSVIMRTTGMAHIENHVHNDNLPAELETNDEWIYSHTGIHARYMVEPGTSGAALGAEACREALEKAGVAPEEIDYIICATTTPEHTGLPSDACLIQAELGAKSATCFDVTAACTGFLYSMDNAAALLERHGKRYALIVGTEVLSRICDWKDRTSCILFGDGAGAALLENVSGQQEGGISSYVSGSDGTGAMALYVGKDGLLKMDGHAVYNFAVGIMTKVIKEVMEKEGVTADEVDYFVCHQANERIISAAAKRLGLSMEKFVMTLSDYGNTSSASIPITLNTMEHQGLLKKGTTIVTAAFGGGLTWAGALLRF